MMVGFWAVLHVGGGMDLIGRGLQHTVTKRIGKGVWNGQSRKSEERDPRHGEVGVHYTERKEREIQEDTKRRDT